MGTSVDGIKYSGYSILLRDPQKAKPAKSDTAAVTPQLKYADPAWSTINYNVFLNDNYFSSLPKFNVGDDRKTGIALGILNQRLFGGGYDKKVSWDFGWIVDNYTDLNPHADAIGNLYPEADVNGNLPDPNAKVKENIFSMGVYGNLRLRKQWEAGPGQFSAQLLTNGCFRYSAGGSSTSKLATLDFNSASLNYDNLQLGNDFAMDFALKGRALYSFLDGQKGVIDLMKSGAADLLKQNLSLLALQPYAMLKWYDSSARTNLNIKVGGKLNMTPGLNDGSNPFASKYRVFANMLIPKSGTSMELEYAYEGGRPIVNVYAAQELKFKKVTAQLNLGLLDLMGKEHRSYYFGAGGDGAVNIADTELNLHASVGLSFASVGKKQKAITPNKPWEDSRSFTGIQKPVGVLGPFQPMDEITFMTPAIISEKGNNFKVLIGTKNFNRVPGVVFEYLNGDSYGDTAPLTISSITVYDNSKPNGKRILAGVGSELIDKPLGDIRDNPLVLNLPCTEGGEDQYTIKITLSSPAGVYPDDPNVKGKATVAIGSELGIDSINPGIIPKSAR